MMKRGIRNNNPLNIRHSADHWQGARAKQTDRSFVQFESMAYGYRAAWKTLESYWRYFHDLAKAFSVRNIISRWAPPTENDTDAYIRAVVKLTGLGGNENFPRPSRATSYERMESLIRAMTTIECGIPYGEVDVEAICEGFDLAFPGKRKLLKQCLVPNIPVDIGESQLIDREETDYEYWDEYRDW